MMHSQSFHKTTWRYIGLATIAVVMAVAIVSPMYAGLLALMVLVAGLVAVLLTPTHKGQRSTSSQRTASYRNRLPMVEQPVFVADGKIRQAWIVPIEQQEGYQFVMTKDGYMIVDSTGKAIHTLIH